MKSMNVENLIYLTVILFVVNFVFIQKKEKLTNLDSKKECSQNDINQSYIDYIFGIRQAIR